MTYKYWIECQKWNTGVILYLWILGLQKPKNRGTGGLCALKSVDFDPIPCYSNKTVYAIDSYDGRQRHLLPEQCWTLRNFNKQEFYE